MTLPTIWSSTMKQIQFVLKSPEDTQEWLIEAAERLSMDDMNYIASMAWMISNMEDFIFNDDKITSDFMDHMQVLSDQEVDFIH